MEPAIAALAEKIETDIGSIFKSFPIGDFDSMDRNFEEKYLVAGHTAYSAMRTLPTFSEYESAPYAGSRAIIDGRVGRLDDAVGTFVLRSPYMDPNEKVLFTKNSVHLVMRRAPVDAMSKFMSEFSEIGSFGLTVETKFEPSSLSQIYTILLSYGVVMGNGRGILFGN
jgi:hypothetical protein